MAIQTINLGTAGTPSGDTVRQGFSKCNANFNDHDSRIGLLESGSGGIATPLNDGKGTAIVRMDVDEGGGILRIETTSGLIWVVEGLFTI